MAVPRITKEELKKRLDGEPADLPVIIDVRLKYPYEHSTVKLPGALRLTAGAPGSAALPKDRDIVLYDSDPEDLVSERAAWDLIRQGYRAYALAGGIADWVNAKLPVESKPAPLQAAFRAGAAPGAVKG